LILFESKWRRPEVTELICLLFFFPSQVGSSNYRAFHAFPKRIDKGLSDYGGKRLLEFHGCDTLGDFEAVNVHPEFCF
jgi:hypothetical protein